MLCALEKKMYSVLIQWSVLYICIIIGLKYLSANSVAQSCSTLCNPMDCSTPGLPVHHHWWTQTYFHWVGDAIQPSHPLSSPSPPAFNHSQHQGLFQWVSSSHQVARILEFQLQHQSFQRTFRVDFLCIYTPYLECGASEFGFDVLRILRGYNCSS